MDSLKAQSNTTLPIWSAFLLTVYMIVLFLYSAGYFAMAMLTDYGTWTMATRGAGIVASVILTCGAVLYGPTGSLLGKRIGLALVIISICSNILLFTTTIGEFYDVPQMSNSSSDILWILPGIVSPVLIAPSLVIAFIFMWRK